MLMPMPPQQGVFNLFPTVIAERTAGYHIIQHTIGNLFQWRRFHIENHGAVKYETPKLEQRVQGESSNVGFGPSVATLLDIFFKLDPSCRLFPFELVSFADQLFHFGKQRMRLEGAIVHVLAENELHPLRRGSHWKRSQRIEIRRRKAILSVTI